MDQKMDDCYFYYYSTCAKGDACPFRHEPNALGTESVCRFWKQNSCIKPHCTFRHMEMTVDRSKIACYWESQPGGCRKPHCPFFHTVKPLTPTNDVVKTMFLPARGKQISPKHITSMLENSPQLTMSASLDPLVVNFEEESDDSIPSVSPRVRNSPKCKTSEQKRLDKIQSAAAAYYQYDNQGEVSEAMEDCRERLKRKLVLPASGEDLRSKMQSRRTDEVTVSNVENIKVLSIAEIREKRRRKFEETEEATHPSASREPKKRITYDYEEAPDVRVEIINVVPEEELAASKKMKRPPSPVVFDISEKKDKKAKKVKKEKKEKKEKKKTERKVNVLHVLNTKPKSVFERVSCPNKPIVAVPARKRSADETPSVFKRLKTEPVKSVAEPKTKKPERPLWRPSRLAKMEESEPEQKVVIGLKPRSSIVAKQTEQKPESSKTEPSSALPLKLKRQPVIMQRKEEKKPEAEQEKEPVAVLPPKPSTTDSSFDMSLEDDDFWGPSSNADDIFVNVSDDKILEDIDALLQE
ncbi:Hypothetical predicted protein [Cloeon dipterum]|uniref:C3H1-type domain-containing protein n=1 Tax=Cloeon dipterum TaxID=197152 RepID=A0A8S1BV91_9INSE|nr:Hypothetical predicted protein [Cloeon dipterum]